MMETRARTYLKAVLWQFLGLLVGGGVAYAFTGSLRVGGALAAINAGVGLLDYVLYERLWNRISWGRSTTAVDLRDGFHHH